MNHPKGFPRISLAYIAREFIFSFAIAFLFFFVVFFINQILLLAEDILAKSAPLAQTGLLLLYSLPSVVAIASPFAALAGALMTSARLNSDNEIMAFSALGISPAALYAPFIAMGLLTALLSFSANDYFLPRGAVAFRRVYGDLVSRSASIELTPYSVKRYSNAVVVTGDKKGDEIGDILLFEKGGEGDDRMIAAGSARLEIDPDGNAAVISMRDVLEHAVRRTEAESFFVSTAESMLYRFELKEPVVGFSGNSPSEMSTAELSAAIARKRGALDGRRADVERQRSEARALLVANYGKGEGAPAAGPPPSTPPVQPTPPAAARIDDSLQEVRRSLTSLRQASTSAPADRSLQIYELERSKKFAIPAAAFFFSLLAFPLGLGARRSGRTAGFGIALLLSSLYWGLLFIGQTFGLKSRISPQLAMWFPNILVLGATFVVWGIRRKGQRRSV
jgi:lipopolysaccharide export system permease protein